MKVVTFKIEEDLLDLLDWYAMNHKLERSVAIRKAIETMLKEEMKEGNWKARVEKMRL